MKPQVIVCWSFHSSWQLGPLRIEYHRYLGPTFWIGERPRYPARRINPWWLLWRLVRKRLQREATT